MEYVDKFEELINHMRFLEQLSVKVHGLRHEEEIYFLINDYFKESGQYTVGLLMLTEDGHRLKIITSLRSKNIKKAEKIACIKFSDYYIDLNKSTIYSQVVREGKTIQTTSLDIMKELLPSPLNRLINRALGLEENYPIITPIRVKGQIIGALSLNACYLASYLIPTVENFALHISTAIKFVRERKKRKEAEKKLKDMAYYDGLTSLPNRTLFLDRAKVALSQADRNKRQVGIIMLDIDNFKSVNDNFGHHTGDQLLVGFGKRLKELIRSEDTVSRAGGDEFLILVQGARRVKDIEKVARKMLASFETPINIDDQEIKVFASLGISVYPGDAQNSNDLIKKADQALLEVKRTGKNNFKFFKIGGKHVE